MANRPRPLSPHLQVYRLPLVAKLSILHRITGLIISAGGAVLVALILCVAAGPDYYAWVADKLNGHLGLFLSFGLLFSLCYHLLNGIRHLFWDAGKGFELDTADASGWAVVITALIASAAIAGWIFFGGAA